MNIPPDCEARTRNRRIVLEENSRKITFTNDTCQEVRRIRIDGCVITDGIRCDYLLIDSIEIEYYVELKGSDVKHAVEQLKRTIELVSKEQWRQQKFCFIISSRCPLLTPKIQELKVRFKKKYNAELIIKNNAHEHKL